MSDLEGIKNETVAVQFKTVEAADAFITYFLDCAGDQHFWEVADNAMEKPEDSYHFRVKCGDWDWNPHDLPDQ